MAISRCDSANFNTTLMITIVKLDQRIGNKDDLMWNFVLYNTLTHTVRLVYWIKNNADLIPIKEEYLLLVAYSIQVFVNDY